MMAGRFDFRLLPTLLTAALLALLLWLGTWQLSRAEGKRELLERFDRPAATTPWQDIDEVPPRYTPVTLTGVYDAERQVLLEGISVDGQSGVEVLTPLGLPRGGVVMVNRGWVPWNGARDSVPQPTVPAGEVTLAGRVRPFAQAGMSLGDGNASAVPTWPRLAVYPGRDEIAAWLGQRVADAQVLLDADAPGGFVRRWRPDLFPPSRHVGYAVQWYGLAAALVVLFVIASYQSEDKEAGSDRGKG